MIVSTWLRSAALLAAFALPSLAAAQDYPTHPVMLEVAFTPGGPSDVLARIVGKKMEEILGQPFVIENRPGAGGNIGSDAIVHAEPDGYSLLMCTVSSGAINYSLYGSKMPYKPEDLAAAGLMLQVPNAIFVANSLPVKTLKDLVDYAKARPGKLNNGSSGPTSEMFGLGGNVSVRW